MARIIFYQKRGVKELDKWMSLHLKDNDIVFERDRHFQPAPNTKPKVVQVQGYRTKTYEDYLDEEDCYEIDARALRGEDISPYEGIFLGKMAEYKLMKYFVALFKDIALLAKLREKENAKAFVFVDDNSPFSKGLKEFSTRYGIETEVVVPSRRGQSRKRLRRCLSFFCLKSLIWRFLVFAAKFCRKKIKFKQTIVIEGYGKFIPLIKRLAEEGNRVIVLGRLGFEKALFQPNISYYPWARLRKIDKIKKFLINRKVTTIITLQDRDGINRILVATGNSLGLNTIEIQHGTLANLPYLVSPISRKIFVWGKAGKEFYLKREIEQKRIYITGDPNLERLKKADSQRITGLKKTLGLVSDKPTILFASQPFIKITSLDSPLKTLDLFEGICETAQKLPEVEFLIKFHPNENSEIKRAILKRYHSKNLFVAERGLINELLSLSHLLITFCSSIVLEASLLGVPIIMVNLTGKRDFLPVVEMGGALGVYEKKDLIPSIKCLLYDEGVRKKLIEGQERFIASQIDLGGDSLKRMVEII